MKKRYIIILAGIVLTFALLTGCGVGPAGQAVQQPDPQTDTSGSSTGTSQREEELQKEIDSLRQELDEIKKVQESQESGTADQSGTASGGEAADGSAQSNAVQGSADQSSSGSQNSSSSQSSGGNNAQSAGNSSSNASNTGNSASNVKVTLEQAMNIALERVPGATEQNISIHLDFDDGWYVYEGDILYNRTEYEFDIDANTGTVLKWEQESW